MPRKGEKHVTAGERRWQGEFVTPVVDWQEEVIRMLFESNTNGVLQSDLTNRVFKLGVTAKEVRNYLESFRAQHGVQRFSIGNATVWRATTKLERLL